MLAAIGTKVFCTHPHHTTPLLFQEVASVSGSSRECLTLMVAGFANGDVAPPMIILKGDYITHCRITCL